jgi:hypothetical protein
LSDGFLNGGLDPFRRVILLGLLERLGHHGGDQADVVFVQLEDRRAGRLSAGRGRRWRCQWGGGLGFLDSILGKGISSSGSSGSRCLLHARSLQIRLLVSPSLRKSLRESLKNRYRHFPPL